MFWSTEITCSILGNHCGKTGSMCSTDKMSDARTVTSIRSPSHQPYHPEGPSAQDGWLAGLLGRQRVGPGRATPVTPQDASQFLMGDVRTLVSEGVLSVDQAGGLLDKLTAAIPRLDRRRTNAGCNQLGTCLNQVNGLVGAGQLSAAAGKS